MAPSDPLRFESLTAGYPDRLVLHGISACFQPGKVSCLIGPNGAGKTTLIRVASGILTPLSGRVCINGTDLSRLDPARRARLVSVIPQARNLPPAFTAREVVLMGRTAYRGWFGNFTRQDEQIVEEAMRRTDTLDLAGRRMGELSGGEAQRVLVARALAQQAQVMLLDEPTTHLDIHYQVGILDLLRELVREDQLVLLLAIHDLNLVSRYADQVLLLLEGRVAAQGSTREVLTGETLRAGYRIGMRVLDPGAGLPPVIVPE